MVGEELLKELQKIIAEDYGRDLDMSEISEIGNGLVGYFDLLAKINYKNSNQSDGSNE